MRKQHAMVYLIGASVTAALLFLIIRSAPDESNSSDASGVVQVQDDEAPVTSSVNPVDSQAEQDVAESQEDEQSIPESVTNESSSAANAPESLSLFFMNEEDYIKVATFWSEQSDRYGKRWLGHLESELTRSDEELNSRTLEELSASATLGDPRYTYDPPLTAEQLSPVCSNLVCKVQIPRGVKIARDFSAGKPIPGSRLDTYSQVMFTHGFGYHMVLNQPSENMTTHYFLANGYEP